MVKMLRKTKKVVAAVLTAGMLVGAMSAPVAAASEGWRKNTVGWWYQNADGSYPANKWEKIKGVWYHFDSNGYMMANSWVKDAAGEWYYVGSDGAMKTNSWIQGKAEEWYYVGSNGAMKVNDWARDKSGKWYYVGMDGVMQTNTWIQDKDEKTYYMGEDGTIIVDSDGSTVIGDLKCDIDDSWTLLNGDSTGVVYMISQNESSVSSFMALVSDTKTEVSEEDLVSTKEALIEQYKNYNITVVSDTTIDTPCGRALSFTIDASNLLEGEGVSGSSAYVKQVLLVNNNKIYILQIISLKGDFASIESEFDAMIASISK